MGGGRRQQAVRARKARGSRQSVAAQSIKVGGDAKFRVAAHRNRLTNHETVGGSRGRRGRGGLKPPRGGQLKKSCMLCLRRVGILVFSCAGSVRWIATTGRTLAFSASTLASRPTGVTAAV